MDRPTGIANRDGVRANRRRGDKDIVKRGGEWVPTPTIYKKRREKLGSENEKVKSAIFLGVVVTTRSNENESIEVR